MAGEDDFAVVLLILLLMFRVSQNRNRRRFLERFRFLNQRITHRRIMALMYMRLKTQRRACYPANRKRKTVWVYPRPQFWFEHMLANQHEDRLWQEHFRMTRQTFEYICQLVGPDMARQDTNMRKSIPIRKRVAMALLCLANGDSYRVQV